MGINVTADDAALDLLSEKGFDPVYGARPLRRAIQGAVEDAAAEKILDGSIKTGDKVTITVIDGKIELVTNASEKTPIKATVS
jgi:ATP-dependent Clp protease ATP-binding subunit ClpA